MRTAVFFLICLVVARRSCSPARSRSATTIYFFAGYVVLQYVVLSTAWNILGGYCGYVNFGSAAFFALGAYSTVAIYTQHFIRCRFRYWCCSAAWCPASSASAWAI